MRILVANDGVDDAGGVHTYLAAVLAGLAERGHEVALLHVGGDRAGSPAPPHAPHFGVLDRGLGPALQDVAAWRPDVAFSHNMSRLDVDEALLAAGPVVKMMHGYFGTCLSGQKAHLFPGAVACDRRLGPGCVALYAPRRCGQLRLGAFLRGHAWAHAQAALLPRYDRLVVASGHMRREYVRHGVPEARVHAIPLFAPAPADGDAARDGLVFLGRMTELKGGDVLLRAVASLRPRPRLTLAGDGPRREAWRALAARLGVQASWPGWLGPEERDRLLSSAALLVVPSVWPEPFGLVGLEAGARGVPAVAFDVGGIGEWLRDGENGWLVREAGSAAALARALASALGDPVERSRRAGAARAAAQALSRERHLRSLEAVLEGAARRPA